MPIWLGSLIRLFFSNSYMPNAILASSILASFHYLKRDFYKKKKKIPNDRFAVI